MFLGGALLAGVPFAGLEHAPTCASFSMGVLNQPSASILVKQIYLNSPRLVNRMEPLSRFSMSKILVADDDPLLSRLVEFRLKQQGFEVVLAVNGEQALTLARSEKPSLIILDGMMPILDGFEALRQLKEAAELRHIPVVMLSLKGKEEDIVNCLNLGAADYVLKPFKPGELVTRIRKLLGPEVAPPAPQIGQPSA